MHLITLATAIWTALAVLLLLPSAVLLFEIVLGLRRYRAHPTGPSDRRATVAVIVPAHNEAPIIAPTLRSITPQLIDGDRLLVVADNCSDETAAVAASEGAEVLVRSDPQHRGKGYALDFAIRNLTAQPPEVVIVIDADCQVALDAIGLLARRCRTSARPVQALYRMLAPHSSTPMGRLKQFACAVKNEARPHGLHQLDLSCQLMGSGMAFPWDCINSATLATGHIVEDLQLGIELARRGRAPLFCPEAVVTSELPAANEGIESQRTRWEHGHLAVMLREGPRLLLRALLGGDRRGIALAADLMVPPLALLLLLIAAHWLTSLLLYALAHSVLPLILSTIAAALLVLAVMLAWLGYGRSIIPLRVLALVPIYALGKVGLYARFFRTRQQEWVRSRRNHEAR